MKIKNISNLKCDHTFFTNLNLTSKELEILNWLFVENKGMGSFTICCGESKITCSKSTDRVDFYDSQFGSPYFTIGEINSNSSFGMSDFRRFCSLLDIEDESDEN